MSFGFSPDYAEQEAIKRRDNTQSDKGKFLFVKLSLIAAQWLSNLYQNGNLFCAAQLNRRKHRVVVRSCLSKTRPAEKRIKISTRKLWNYINQSRLYNKWLAFKMGTFIVDIPCFAAGKRNLELHLVVQPVDVLSVVWHLLLWSDWLLDVGRQFRKLNFNEISD